MWYPQYYDPLMAGSIDGTDTEAHDRAIARAMNAYCTIINVNNSLNLFIIVADTAENDPKIQSDPYCTLFVGKLYRSTTEKKLHEVFSRWGPIRSLRLVRDIGMCFFDDSLV